MDKKLVLFDVDGTLVSYDGVLPQSTIDGIDEARKKGHLVFMVTGRCKGHAFDGVEALTNSFDGLIGGNGAYIEINDKIVKNETISLDDIKRIVDYLDSRHLEYFIEAGDNIYGSHNFETRGAIALEQYGKKNAVIREIYPTMEFPESLYVEGVSKINYILESYDDYLEFKKDFPEFKVMTWGGQGESAIFGDCALANIDKATAIKELQEYVNITPKDTISFGDAEVDIPMFGCGDISVCVGDGRKEAKDAATYVTDEVKNDGIYKALKHFNII